MRSLVLLFVILFASATVAKAEVYKYVDEDGNVHFTDTPPPKQETEKVKIQRPATQTSIRSGSASNSDGEDGLSGEARDRELCNTALNNLRKFTPSWERMIRARYPSMTPEDRKEADKALKEMKAELRKMRSNMSQCVEEMKDPENRRDAECIAGAPDANSALFCML